MTEAELQAAIEEQEAYLSLMEQAELDRTLRTRPGKEVE